MTAAGNLEEATERLNATIARAEAVFAARFAVRGSVNMRVGLTNGQLVWGKLNGWRLAWIPAGSITPMPLANASRETRTCALDVLENLYRELEQQTTGNVAEIERGIAIADAFLSRVAS